MTQHDSPTLQELESYRAEFPILARKTYLNSCSLGALSTRSIAGVQEFLELWATLGASAWYEIWLGEIAGLRERCARVINASPHEIALSPCISTALNSVASALDYSKRPKIVVTDMDFPTVPYQWLARARDGVEVVYIRSEDHITIPVEQFAEVVDERTALVATTHVFFTSGYIQDIKTIAEIAHAKGAYLLVDGYQAAGQLPVDVKASDVDFYLSGGLKWLLGGPGIAFLYVRNELIGKLEPTSTGWFAHRKQFAFDPYHFAFSEDARRFEYGTPAVAAVYAFNRGLDIVLEIGTSRIRQRTSYLVADLVRRLREAGMTLCIPSRQEDHAGIVMVATEDPARVVRGLAERDIIVDHRPGRVRISPYFYNTTAENALLVNAMQETLNAPEKG